MAIVRLPQIFLKHINAIELLPENPTVYNKENRYNLPRTPFFTTSWQIITHILPRMTIFPYSWQIIAYILP